MYILSILLKMASFTIYCYDPEFSDFEKKEYDLGETTESPRKTYDDVASRKRKGKGHYREKPPKKSIKYYRIKPTPLILTVKPTHSAA